MKQCWNIVNLTLSLQWIFTRNSYIFISKYRLGDSGHFISVPQCVKIQVLYTLLKLRHCYCAVDTLASNSTRISAGTKLTTTFDIFSSRLLWLLRFLITIGHIWRHLIWPWWHHHIEIFSASLVLCQGKPKVAGGFPSPRPMTWSFGVFFDLRSFEQAIERPVIWDAIVLIMTSL